MLGGISQGFYRLACCSSLVLRLSQLVGVDGRLEPTGG